MSNGGTMKRDSGVMQDNLKITYDKRIYEIEYKMTDEVLFFKDKDGASVGFVKKDGALSVYVNDKYSNPKMWKKYPRLKGTNAYTLAPEQVEIFLEWLTK